MNGNGGNVPPVQKKSKMCYT